MKQSKESRVICETRIIKYNVFTAGFASYAELTLELFDNYSDV